MISAKSLLHVMKSKNFNPSQRKRRLTEKKKIDGVFIFDLMVGCTFSFLLSALSLLIPFLSMLFQSLFIVFSKLVTA